MYSREIDGQVLILSASGWTYRNTFVLYDHETESIWYHLEGEDELTCISGHWQDRKLPEMGATTTRWSNWKKDHSETKFLNANAIKTGN